MIQPFLKQVADHYYDRGDISSRCFVFPNRRSMVFFRKWLSMKVAESASRGDGKPVMAPQMMTINDLFYRIGGLNVTDKVTLLVELYECYRELNPKAEPLDEFIFWGDVILADFNDVDKYLASPKQLFANVADFKAIQDSYSYLTETQRCAIENFVSHFNDRSGKLTVNLDSDDPNVKERFLQIWNLLYPLYTMYNDRLRGKGLAYEGMVYRTIAESDRFCPDSSYVVVGLNALNECEKTLLRRLRDNGKVEFCWDWSGDMIRDERNRSSFFMADNVKEFPPVFIPDDEGIGRTSFNTLSVPSSYGQVKHVAPILERIGYKDDTLRSSSDTAVVIPDESLLMPLLNSIPENIQDINVTMGYPMSASELYVLVSDVAKMQMHLRRKDNGWYFYHKQVWDILSSGVMKTVLSSDDMSECRERITAIRRDGRYYIHQDDFSGHPLLETVFRPVAVEPSVADSGQTDALAAYLQDVIVFLAPMLAGNPDMALELEFARQCYSSINSLRAKKLAVQPSTFVRLLDSLMSGLTIPFKGEPLKGLQIMGPLETRALDFRNVIILSCNEGMFPRRNVSSSFVPPELRKAFSLPTYEYQDAIWAYYFYRLVSRAENVWMVYDSRSEGLKRGEESRYIKQLRYHFGVDVCHHVAEAGSAASQEMQEDMEKTDEMMERIGTMTWSVSALQNYVICPMKFCYQSVLRLKKDEDVAESLDNAMIGNVYHNVMWALYHGEEAMKSDAPFEKLEGGGSEGMPKVTASYLESWLAREDDVRSKVVSLMKAELKTDEITGRDLVVQRVIVRYVMETVRKDLLLLARYGSDGFDMAGLEKQVYAQLYGVPFFGVVDRMDSIVPGMIRMVDYKTGNDSPSVIAVTDDMAQSAVEKVFDSAYEVRKANKAALQFHIYDRMVQASGLVSGQEQLCNSLYATSDLFRNVPSVFPSSGRFSELMDERLSSMIAEIRDRNVPFSKTQETDACRYCDFRMICGR